jgi:hypothetical protein
MDTFCARNDAMQARYVPSDGEQQQIKVSN